MLMNLKPVTMVLLIFARLVYLPALNVRASLLFPVADRL